MDSFDSASNDLHASLMITNIMDDINLNDIKMDKSNSKLNKYISKISVLGILTIITNTFILAFGAFGNASVNIFSNVDVQEILTTIVYNVRAAGFVINGIAIYLTFKINESTYFTFCGVFHRCYYRCCQVGSKKKLTDIIVI